MTEGLEQGRLAGYEDGFIDGEAKGVAAAEARTERYFSLLAQALSELETLRGEVLRAGQDIFLEIANLCCEKILRQKLGSSDEALKKLFLSAVEAYADAHRVTLEMSPSDAARMKGAFDSGVQAKVVVRENPDLAPGDFRADSDKEILTVDLKRAVEGLIEGLRAELFPQDTAADSQRIASEKSRKTG
jgi:flagellar biosynthesis/type III secretory pathway protein FliH